MSRSLLLAALALLASGCVSSELGRIQRDMEPQIETGGQAEVGRGFSMSFGRGSIGSTRFLSRLVAPESTEPYRRLSRHVHRLRVARYPIEGAFDASQVRRPDALERYDRDGWLPLVTVRDSSAAVWVLYRDSDDIELRDLLAVVLGDGELVMTRMSGDLHELILDAASMSGEDILSGALSQTGIFPNSTRTDSAQSPPEADGVGTSDG